MKKTVSVGSWIKWLAKIISLKYWINLVLLFSMILLIPFATEQSILLNVSLMLIGGFNLVILLGGTSKEMSELFKGIFDYFHKKYKEIVKHFSEWWSNKP